MINNQKKSFSTDQFERYGRRRGRGRAGHFADRPHAEMPRQRQRRRLHGRLPARRGRPMEDRRHSPGPAHQRQSLHLFRL